MAEVAAAAAAAAAAARWSGLFAGGDAGRRPFPGPREVYDALSGVCGGRVDVWRTEYFHRLDGHEAIVAWLRESGLRPYLDRFGADEEGREAFLGAYLEEVRKAYPANGDGSVLLKFPRLFFVAVKK